MITAIRLVSFVGWRGLVGVGLGAVLAATPAYHAGKWAESSVQDERIGRLLAERDVKLMRAENDRVEKANEARRRAIGAAGVELGDGGLPDDGYRRD